MSTQDYLFKLSYLSELIDNKNTGTADHIAEKLGISRRTIFRYLKDLKLMGAEISFDQKRNTYVFEEEFNVINSLFKGR